MALIECPECRHRVSQRATACPQCAHPIAPPAAKPSLTLPSVVTVQDHREKQMLDGLGALLEAAFVHGPGIVSAGGLWMLTGHPLAVPVGGALGFLGAWFVQPFRRYVTSRDLLVKILAVGLGAFVCYGAMVEFLKT